MTKKTPVKFTNAKGMKKWWGEEEPKVLMDAFSYLHRSGFTGPMSWDDPALLCLVRDVDDDLFIKVLFQSLGEDGEGVYWFDTAIHVCSRLTFEIEARLDLWEKKNRAIESQVARPHVTLWSVDLSHLKWNSVPGPNPCWVANEDCANSGPITPNWISDWQCYGEPYLAEIHNAGDAARKLLAIPKYVSSHWVKSDGPVSSAAYERAVILLILAGARDEAMLVLREVERAILELEKRAPVTVAEDFFRRRVRKLKEWAS